MHFVMRGQHAKEEALYIKKLLMHQISTSYHCFHSPCQSRYLHRHAHVPSLHVNPCLRFQETY